MMKRISSKILGVVLALCFIAGCKPSGKSGSHGYFQTHYQDESQFIVETIASDLAEEIYYAKYHRLPDAKKFFVSATETPDSPFETPVYDLLIEFDKQHHGLKMRLNVNGPIWSPAVYDGLTTLLAQTVGLNASENAEPQDTTLLAKLTDGEATTIEKENQDLSAALEDDFVNPVLHEQAAVLLGAFTLREHSGDFFEIRSPLCRITAHLAMARFLNGGNDSGINGSMAEVMLLTLMNNQAAALEKLNDIKTNDAALISWARALRARNTGDYRPLDKLDGLSRIESVAWFGALDESANTDIAWSRLSDVQKEVPDFVRIANAGNYSVGVGHELLALSLPLEFDELAAVYQLSQHKKLGKDELTAALNQMPERCFSVGPDNKMGVHIIGWGLWAGFFQRQLCHAIQHDFDFLQRKWGVPDEAKKFSDKCDALFSGLRLYPFVERFDCTDVATYHKAVDDGFKVTVATPQLVPAECWNYLCYRFSPAEWYRPNPNPHINEWHKHNPPPGTAYDACPRLDHPSLTRRPDSEALLDKLHELAPYDWNYTYYIWNHKYKNAHTYKNASALFQPVLAYANYAMETVADTVQDQPDRYEQLLSKAAKVNPSDYFTLADYFIKRKADDKAAGYIEKGNANDPDSVRASYYANWLIKYYLKNSRTNDARREADFAGEVYSYVGLQAKAEFLEATGDYAGAFQWFSNIEERYDDSGPVIAFCLRYKAKTGSTQFDGEVQKRLGKLFPKGIEKVSLGDFQSAPGDGVLIQGEDNLIRDAGLHRGDVIVAVYGIRVHDFAQYNYGRESSSNPELDLIVWQNGRYNEIKTSPPNHRFGVDFGDYPPK